MDEPSRPIRTMEIRFVGSGSEYFRIWIVNLLLTLVTLGLYYPFAKLRRLRYFHGCTEVDGHPLEFHGNGWAMLRGYLLVLALTVAYGVAQRYSEAAATVALLALLAIGPALWVSALRFRLANTSWRGVRLHFTGSMRDGYRALAPGYAVLAAISLLSLLVQSPDPKRPEWTLGAALVGLLSLSLPLAMPWLLWRMRRYQHDHYAFASEQTALRCGVKPVYGVFVRASLLGLALAAVVFGGVALWAWLAPGSSAFAKGRSAAFGFVLVGIPLMLLAQVVVYGYVVAALQNLFWSATGNRDIRFGSRLRPRALIGVLARNWLLMVITLGLYYPFAAVAQARVRLHAMVLHTKVDLDRLVAQQHGGGRDAAGDAAADVLGFDIGL